MEAGAEPVGRYSSLLNSFRQPKVTAAQATESNQQDDGTKHRAGPRYRNRNHERDGEKGSKEHNSFLPKKVPNVSYIHPVRWQGINHSLYLGGKSFRLQFDLLLVV
jgi:hypothetical protein